MGNGARSVPLSGGDQLDQLRHDLPDCSRAVAEDGFDGGGELAEGAVAFDDFEERVIAEAAAAGGLKKNAAAAEAFAFGPDIALGVRERGIAGVVRGAFFQRHAAELFQQ